MTFNRENSSLLAWFAISFVLLSFEFWAQGDSLRIFCPKRLSLLFVEERGETVIPVSLSLRRKNSPKLDSKSFYLNKRSLKTADEDAKYLQERFKSCSYSDSEEAALLDLQLDLQAHRLMQIGSFQGMEGLYVWPKSRQNILNYENFLRRARRPSMQDGLQVKARDSLRRRLKSAQSPSPEEQRAQLLSSLGRILEYRQVAVMRDVEGQDSTPVDQRHNLNIKLIIIISQSLFRREVSVTKEMSKSMRQSVAKQNLRFFFGHVMRRVRGIISTIKIPDYSLDLHIVGFMFIDEDPFVHPKEINNHKAFDGKKSLDRLNGWVLSWMPELPEFDHIMFFGDSDVYNSAISSASLIITNGTSFIGSMCTKKRISYCETKQMSTYHLAINVAHELGHSMGMQHDDDSSDCPEKIYVMTPEAKREQHLSDSFFSECSLRDLSSWLKLTKRTKKDCFKNFNSVKLKSKLLEINDTAPLLGEKFDANQQCRREYGKDSYLCHIEKKDNVVVCSAMWCMTSDGCKATSGLGFFDGTSCGNKKWCIKNKCEFSSEATENDENCLYGDRLGKIAVNETTNFEDCSEVVSQAPDKCEVLSVKEACCNSCPTGICPPQGSNFCKNIVRQRCYKDQLYQKQCCSRCPEVATHSTSDCKYGNRLPDEFCQKSKKALCYQKKFRAVCCLYCHDIKSKDKSCKYGDLVSNCQHIIKVPSHCYSAKRHYTCCETCKQHHTANEGCEYGDRSPKCRPWFCNHGPNYSKNLCCQTCTASRSVAEKCAFGDLYQAFCRKSANKRRCKYRKILKYCCASCNKLLCTDIGEECKTITDAKCYNEINAQICCKSCKELKDITNPECPYGDREEDCKNLNPEECNDDNISKVCCKTCSKSRSCSGREEPEECQSMKPFNCYNEEKAKTCCETCLRFQSKDPHCKYGNRKQDCEEIKLLQCYKPNYEINCCKTCLSLRNSSAPIDCKYGDHADNCRNMKPSDCYDDDKRFNCCLTCDGLREAEPGCAYGDLTSCQSISATKCYADDMKKKCCKSCKMLQKAHQGSCQFGDKDDTLCSEIEAKDCYNNETQSKCCETCQQLRKGSVDCEYGNRESSCSSIAASKCYDLGVSTKCCELCAKYKKPNIDCEYGDRGNNCNSIKSFKCYEKLTRASCCHTCDKFRKGGDSRCEFGDREEECNAINAYECYQDATQKQCCATCKRLYTNNRVGCEYGDKMALCQNSDCDDEQTRMNCCLTCAT